MTKIETLLYLLLADKVPVMGTLDDRVGKHMLTALNEDGQSAVIEPDALRGE